MATKYRVQGPDGAVHIFEGPDDATPAQVETFAAQTFSAAPAKPALPTAPVATSGVPGPRRQYPLTEVPSAAIANIPASAKKFGAGVYEAITHPIETIQGAWDLSAGALQNVLPEKAVNFINQFEGNPAAAKRAVDTANAFGGLYKEKYGTYENFKRTLAEDPVGAAADLSTILSGGSTVTSRLAPNLSQALKTAATATNPVSVVTKPAQAVIAAKNKILPSEILKEKEANVVRDATLRAGLNEGYVTTPGSVSATSRNVIAERMAGKTHLEQLASVQNQAVTDRLARRAVGMPQNTPLTSAAMQDIRKAEYNKGYAPIEKLGEIKTDPTFLDDLINIEGNYTGPSASFPGGVPDAVSKLIKNYTVDKFDAKDAVKVSRQLRSEASDNFRKGDSALAKAQTAVSNSLENQIERSLSSTNQPNANKLLEQFRLSRQRMAVSHSIEDAIKEGSGSVIAAKLARDIQSGKYVSGDIKTIAEFSNVFPRVTQTPSQIGAPGAGTMMGRAVGGGLGAAIGGMVGGPTGAMYGAGAALAPELTSAAMRNYLLSGGAQNRLIPSYKTLPMRLTSDQAAQNALRAQQLNQQREQNRLRIEVVGGGGQQ